MKHAPLTQVTLSDRLSLSVTERTLYRDGEPVRIGARALEILIVLAERPGHLVSKNELLTRVWPQQFVDETALRVHLSMLRRLLASDGDDRKLIVNENGRGYRLLLPTVGASPTGPAGAAIRSTVPIAVASMLGRDAMVARCLELLASRRLLTLCGPGGIGKTTLALAVAAAFSAERKSPALLLDLAHIADAEGLHEAFARQLGLEVGQRVPDDAILQAVGALPVLLVLDTCEPIADAAAVFAEGLLALLPNLVVLATSREALRAAGEWVLQVPPLAPPQEGLHGTACQILQSPAVRLFIERAQALRPDFHPNRTDLAQIIHICEELDGIPLAIEMAASRLATHNLQELGGLLQEGLSVLTNGRRTALERHRTLQAAIDWSVNLLCEPDQDIFERLCSFRGSFSMDDAIVVLRDAGIQACAVIDAVAALVASSLLTVQQKDGVTRYRFYRTIRRHGLDRLRQGASWHNAHRAHARYILALARTGTTSACADCVADITALVEEIRAALIWAAGPDGDADLAAALIAGSSRLLRDVPIPMACLDLRDSRHGVSAAGSARLLVRQGKCEDARRLLDHTARGRRARTDAGALFEPRLILADLG
ncbi:winged helix-turn-helix domain-containing protein [Rhizobium sp. CSW-27]|uniref:ATP-binding protein n=1 Tax=Rhizobium sp. CSW-27 TaxID=2839985 RepID=UPI001C00F2CC|nr:winged helix-turn-helix domain-containing protein [Rhizobium sp. CSW-27]MBT9369851.1 winged helix-turn-helix domain-containing protein [Rhizobium sp. CSW-27]